MGRLVIGLTGAFGSGCTFLADNFFKEIGFSKYSLSDELRNMFKEEYGKGNENRQELQKYGNKVRNEKNSDFLATQVANRIEEIEKLPEEKCIVVDSIRNPAEIKYFRSKYPDFFLIAIFADYEVRWERVKNNYKGLDSFNEDEIKDQGNNEPEYGQKVSNCFFEADLIISNNDYINTKNPNESFYKMKDKIRKYINAFNNPLNSYPTTQESLMAIAYTSGRRSKCLKRRVGAIIVDNYNNVLSSGFNEVPNGLKDCATTFGECYRDKCRSELKLHIENELGDIKDKGERSKNIVDRLKVLDFCRSLHAEERTILNLIGNSSKNNFAECTLYVTTYPCNLCANKIVQIGIKKVVYFEPYPVEQAKKIFVEAKVESVPFEGVTFRSFFRAFNYEA